MKVVILAGGLGTRISEESHLKPKPMIEVGEMPILWHIMKYYSSYGLNEFIILAGYKQYVIKEYFANYFLHNADITFDMGRNTMEVHNSEAEDWKVTVVDTGLHTMTGGRIKRVEKYLHDEPFMLTYGDGVSDVNLQELLVFHKKKGKVATITMVNLTQQKGVLDVDQDGIIHSFREKEEKDGAVINGGFMVLEPEIFRYLQDDRTILEQSTMQALASEGKLTGYYHPGCWQCMDTQREKKLLEELWASGKEFYKGRRVFVTGHNGFKGSWLTLLLEELGAEVYGYSLPAKEGELFSILYPKPPIYSFEGDVRNYEQLRSLMEWAHPEVVFHLAAQPIVRESYLFPRETHEINVMGTVNLLESIRHIPSVRSVLNVTTDKVYENNDMEHHAFTEEEKLDGFDPYSNSKSCSEILTHSYQKSFFNEEKKENKQPVLPRISTARAGNVIGGGDFAKDRIVPDAVRAVVRGQKIGVRNPYSVRPYQHVLEPLLVYLEIAARQAGFVKGLCKEKFSYEQGKRFEGYYNVGPSVEDAITTGELTDLFVKFWGETAAWENLSEKNAPHEAGFLQLNTNKVRRTFQWEPRYTVKDAVKETVAWYKAWSEGKDMRKFSVEQIQHFFCESHR